MTGSVPRRWILAALGGLVVAGGLIVFGQPTAARRAADFTVIYSAALLVRDGSPQSAYDQARLGALTRAVSDGAIDPRLPFDYPLVLAYAFTPLTLLPVDLAFRSWQVISLGVALAALIALQRQVGLGPRAPAWAMVGMLAAAPTWAMLTQGQFSSLLLLGAALLVAAGRSGSRAAGAAGAFLLAFKPQYLPPYLIVLLVFRQGQALLAALGGAAAAGLSPLLAGGPSGLRAMIADAIASDHLVPLRLNESWIGPLASVTPESIAAVLAVAIFGLAPLGLFVLGQRAVPALLPFIALAGTVAVLAAPRALSHDLVLLVVPAWIAVGLQQRGHLPSLLPALGLIELAVVLDLRGAAVPLAPLVVTGVLVAYGREFMRRAEGSPRADSRPAA